MARTSRKGGALKPAALLPRVWKTAVYARLSLEDGGRKGADTIETQIELVTAYVKQRDYLTIADTYVDNGFSGKDLIRPAWIRLMDDIRAGRVDCVCVKDLSRFSRNYIETCEFLEKIFPFMGVRFVSVNDGFDSETPTGKNEGLLIALKSLVHDQYLRDISRKISSSAAARRERGEYTCTHPPFGYSKSTKTKGRLEPDETTAAVVRDIFKWRAEGMGQTAICLKLEAGGVPSPSARWKLSKKAGSHSTSIWRDGVVRTIIRNPVYLGHLVLGKFRQSLADHQDYTVVPKSEWIIKENMHEPLVSKELWDAANAVETERRTRHCESLKHGFLTENIFRGFLTCGFCGTKMTRRHNNNTFGKPLETYHYFCSLSRIHAKDDAYRMLRFDKLYGLVFPLVAERLKSAANLGVIIEKRAKRMVSPRAVLDAEISRVSRELETINQRQAALYESYVDKLLKEMEYVGLRAEYENRADTLRASIEELSRRAAVVGDVSVSDNRWLKAARDFQNPTELTREMLEAIVERIEVFGAKGIEIVWKFSDEYALLETCAENKEGE